MDTIKHHEVFDHAKVDGKIAIAGVGALGSALALQLVKLGMSDILLFDPDTIEAHNIPNQVLYGPVDVGKPKVEMASYMLRTLSSCEPKWHITKLPPKNILKSFGVKHVFVCVDSMAARNQIWQDSVYMNPALETYTEGRMGARAVSMFGFDPKDIGRARAYKEHHLYSDEEVVFDKAACGTIMSIGATAMMLACSMTWHFMDTIMGRIPTFDELSYDTSNMSVHHMGKLT